MAQKKQARRWQKKDYLVFHPLAVGPGTIWVQLEVVAVRVRELKYRDRYNYAIYNPRVGVPIETSLTMYDTPQKAVNAGLTYLRATYNTGRPQRSK